MKNHPLKRPVDFEGKSYTDILLDEPSLGAIEAYENTISKGGSELSGMIALLAVDSGWPEGAIRKIKKSDMTGITDALAPFLAEDGGSGGPTPPK